MNIVDIRNRPAGHPKTKVLFIAGPTRSGSTIISNVLGQINGFFHAGEVIEAWDRGRVWKCSCGQAPAACDVWSDIFKELNNAISPADHKEIVLSRNRLSRSHKVFLNHLQPGDHVQANRPNATYSSGLSTLYGMIKTKTGANVIIDSSKNVGYGDTLNSIMTIKLYILHLVRDSRATVFPGAKRKRGFGQQIP